MYKNMFTQSWLRIHKCGYIIYTLHVPILISELTERPPPYPRSATGGDPLTPALPSAPRQSPLRPQLAIAGAGHLISAALIPARDHQKRPPVGQERTTERRTCRSLHQGATPPLLPTHTPTRANPTQTEKRPARTPLMIANRCMWRRASHYGDAHGQNRATRRVTAMEGDEGGRSGRRVSSLGSLDWPQQRLVTDGRGRRRSRRAGRGGGGERRQWRHRLPPNDGRLS